MFWIVSSGVFPFSILIGTSPATAYFLPSGPWV